MADITGYDRGEGVPSTGAAIPKKYHDNGDGTFSEVVNVGGGGATSSAANTPAIASAATALAANPSRKSWSIQNLGTNPLFVRLGAGASTAVFHFVLKGGTADDDGLGATLIDDTWQGVVSVAGASPRYTVSELT